MSAGEVVLAFVTLLGGAAGVGLLCLWDWSAPEDLGRVSDGWRRRYRRDDR